MPPFPLIAVNVGNARMKLGLFPSRVAEGLPEPERTLVLDDKSPEFDRLVQWLPSAPSLAVGCVKRTTDSVLPLHWYIGSVNRPAASRLVDWLREQRPDDQVRLLAASDLPLAVGLPRPDMVGVDRLLDAVAANRLRDAARPAVVVDVGTAITVDLVSADGVFRGGAILPGIAMSARALHEFTDLLPLVEMVELLAAPPPAGADTTAAMRSGLFWGAVGAVRELASRLAPDADPQVFVTGGAGPVVAELLGVSARHVPHLTLAGIALAAGH